MLYVHPEYIHCMDMNDYDIQSDVAKKFASALVWLYYDIVKLPNNILTNEQVKKISRDIYHETTISVKINCDKETSNRFIRLSLDWKKSYQAIGRPNYGYLAYDTICIGRDKVFFDNSVILDKDALLAEITSVKNAIRKDRELWKAKYEFAKSSKKK